MTFPQLLTPVQRQQYDRLKQFLVQTLELLEECKDQDGCAIVRQRLIQFESEALLVVVGEVKAGKSSFLNALLEADLCEVAPDPCTSGIQELVFGEVPQTQTLGPHWERRTFNIELLKSLKIVDTPGTNSILKEHQTITEGYLPYSDLLAFVFAAKNPHTASAWDFLTLIRREWHRKVVFILQQSDLCTAAELAVNRDRVLQYARERGVQEPVVFHCSAKLAREGLPDSGMEDIREYLVAQVQDGGMWELKRQGATQTLKSLLFKNHNRLEEEHAALAEDLHFFSMLQSKIQARREKALRLKEMVTGHLTHTYQTLTRDLSRRFSEGLSVASVLRRSIPFLRDKDFRTWLEDLQEGFQKESETAMRKETDAVSGELAKELQYAFEEISLEISSRQTQQNRATPMTPDRQSHLNQLQAHLQRLTLSDVFSDRTLKSNELANLTLTGGGITALGAVIAFATHLSAADVTGGLIASVGMSLITLTLWIKRGSLLKHIQKQIEHSLAAFREDVDHRLTDLVHRFFHQLEQAMQEPLDQLKSRQDTLDPLLNKLKTLISQVES